MINELISKVAEKAGITNEKAAAVVTMVLDTLKKKLPAPIASQIDSLLGGASSSTAGAMDQAKDAASEMYESAKEKIGSLFHKK